MKGGGAVFVLLLQMTYSWLPLPLWICVWAVIAVAAFTVVLKLLGIVLDFIFKFIDIFT